MSQVAGRAGRLLSVAGLAGLAALAWCRAAAPASNPMPPASAEPPRAESAAVARPAPPPIAFEISPIEVTGRFGAPSSKDVRLIGKLAPQAKLAIVRVEGPEIVASLLPPEGERAAGVRLTLSGKRAGQEVGQVVVSTGLVDPKELVLFWGWKVPGNLTVTPSNPTLNLKLSGPHVVQIAVASSRPDFRVRRAEVTAGPFAGRVLPAAVRGTYTVEVRVVEAGVASGERGFLGKLILVSNDPAEPRKEVPLLALGALDRASPPTSLPEPRTPVLAAPARIALPDGGRGIGFDDLQYAPGLKRILVPAGRTGRFVLLDPVTKALLPIGGFSATAVFHGGHGDGTTSAVELEGQPGKVVATDRGSRTLEIVDASAKRIVASVTLAGSPDYVRFVPSTGQVWVTEPGKKEIEVLAQVLAPVLPIDGKNPAGLSHLGTIPVPGGPESLVIDTVRGRAYTHTWKDQSYAIDLQTRRIVATWANGCQRARGIALDGKRGFLFVGCAEGRATVIDATSGKLLSAAAAGADVDSIAYSATLGHLYVPAGGAADLSIFAVSSRGALVLLGKVPTAADAHTAAFDPVTSTVFLGDPGHGVVLAIHDPFPSSL